MTTKISQITETISETTVTESLEEIISNTINSSADDTDKISIIFSAIGNKLLDMLPSIGFAVFVFVLGVVFSKLILHIFKKFMRKVNVDSAAVGFLSSILKILLYVITLIIALSILNIPMTSLIAILSAAGLAVGLALQNSLSNLA